MKRLHMGRRLYAALFCIALLFAPAVDAATPASWKDTGFSINANGMTLRQVLEEFGRVYGVRVSISTRADAYLTGRLKAESGSAFLDRLTQPYKFRWFVYNDILHIVPRDENASLRLEVGEDAVQDAKAALVGLGLFDSRFGWGELPDEGVVIVSGPRAYVNLVREVLLPDQAKAAQKGKQIMMFRLKYASATDRVINTRGQAEVIPGVKTLLSGLLFGGPASNERLPGEFDIGSGKRSRAPNEGRGGAREVGDTAGKMRTARADNEEGSERGRREKGPAKDDHPRIQADSALNAIVIYDNANKREMYRSLIAELDVEPQQIEIEALIVDIDRSKLAELGVEWGVRSGNTTYRVNSTRDNSQGVELPIPGSTLLISNAARFYARLKALEGTGQARVLAKPTVLTLDNVVAVLDLSQTQYVPLVGERVADLADVTAGTMLRVVPRIVREGDSTRVRLDVDIEDGALGDPTKKSNVTRSTISTQAIIDLQQTLMIGGYHTEAVSKNQQKFPLLGDVPLLGNLFRTDIESHATRERLFLITPRLSGMSGIAAAPRSTVNKLATRVAMIDHEASESLREKQSATADAAGKKDAVADPVITEPAPASANPPAVITPARRPTEEPVITAPPPALAEATPLPKSPDEVQPPARPLLGPSFRMDAVLFKRNEPQHGAAAPPPRKPTCARPKGTPMAEPTLVF